MDEQISDLGDACVKPTRAAEAITEPDRRRGMLSFLTWAFVLSNAVRDIQAEAAGLKATDELAAPLSPAASAPNSPGDLPGDQASYNEWGLSPLPESQATSPASGHLPQISEAMLGKSGPLNASRPDVGEPLGLADGASDAGRHPGSPQHVADDVRPDVASGPQPNISQTGVSLHLDPSDGLDAHVDLSLPPIGATLQGILGSPVLALNEIVGEAVLSQPTTIVSSVANMLTKGLLDGPLASSGIINVLGGPHESIHPNELFSGGKYTDYHLALQAGDTVVTSGASLGAIGVGASIADAIGPSLMAADNHFGHGNGHDGGSTNIAVPSAVDELLVRGSVDIVM